MAKKKVSFEELLGFKKMQKISLERLHPPMAPIVDEKSVADASKNPISPADDGFTDSQSTIDYETIARSSEFQRFIYFLLTGKTHRGKQTELRREVTNKMTKFRGSGMGDVINEFKDKVKRLREK